MPIHKNSDGTWQWGKSGKKYHSRKKAVKQAQAIYANGWKENLVETSRVGNLTVGDLKRILQEIFNSKK